jgi:hypothetical protein
LGFGDQEKNFSSHALSLFQITFETFFFPSYWCKMFDVLCPFFFSSKEEEKVKEQCPHHTLAPECCC